MFILLSTLRDHIRRSLHNTHMFCLSPFLTVFTFFSALHLPAGWEKTAPTVNSTTLFWLRDKTDQTQSCWKELAIGVCSMFVKTAEEGRMKVLASDTCSAPAPTGHLANTPGDSLGTSPSRAPGCLSLQPFPSVPGLPRRVDSILGHAMDGWLCPGARNCSATTPTHSAPLPGHRDLLAGKQRSSLVSHQLWEQFGQFYSWLLISYYYNTCIIFQWGKLPHTFLLNMECGVGRESKLSWACQAAQFGS